MKILVVEDDPRVALIIAECLQKQSYIVEVVADGEAALDFAEVGRYDLIILDWMLPKLDGISVCKRLRDQGLLTAILMLTARGTSWDKVQGLDVGADDYVVKPFDVPELLARVRALLRRSPYPISATLLSWGMLELETSKHEVRYNDRLLRFTQKEYALVELFLRNRDRVLTYDNIIDSVWILTDSPGKEAVKTHLRCIRQKLKELGAPSDLIENIYGVGYRLNPKY